MVHEHLLNSKSVGNKLNFNLGRGTFISFWCVWESYWETVYAYMHT